MQATKTYTARIDSKKRITLRGAKYAYYNVHEYKNGVLMLEPQELKTPLEISKKTLNAMDKAAANFKAGKVSDAIDLSLF